MSWVEKELEKRNAATGRELTKDLVDREDLSAQETWSHCLLLWRRMEETNEDCQCC
jgi:hypothetical protein